MNNQVDKEKIEELASIYLKSLENELINLQQFIANIKETESVVESDKRIAFLNKFHSAVEVAKLTNLASIAVNLAYLASVNSGDIETTIILTNAVNVITSANDYVASKVKIS